YTRSYGDWSSDVCSSDLEWCTKSASVSAGIPPGWGRTARQRNGCRFRATFARGLQETSEDSAYGFTDLPIWRLLVVMDGSPQLLPPAFSKSPDQQIGKSSMSRFLGDELLVIGGGEQVLHLRRVAELDLDHPGAVRVGIDLFRRGRQLLVDLSHGAGSGRIDIRDRLHRL